MSPRTPDTAGPGPAAGPALKRFRYRAVLPGSGELRQGTVEGTDQSAALHRLRADGLLPIEAHEIAAAATPDGPAVDGRARARLPDSLGELAVLLGAGLPLERALAVVAETAPHPGLRAAFAGLRAQVKAGEPLSRAMAGLPGLFPPVSCAMAEAGEMSGRLDAGLSRLAELLERAAALRQTLISALIYPAMLALVAMGAIGVMLGMVVPQFETLFADMKGELPPATALVLGASTALRQHGLTALAVLALLGLGLARWLKRPGVRAALDRQVLRLPLLGPLLSTAETARFARTLAGLVEAGVHLPVALAIARKALGNSHMSAAVERVAAGLREGGGLSGPLAATGCFPPIALNFLRTGEETAQLPLMLTRLADVLDRDLRTATQRLMSVLTPAITVILGLIVAGIIAAILSAILGLNDLALR